MSTLSTDAINACNRLIMTCEDGVQAFRQCAKIAASEDLKQLCMNLGEQREFMITDLQGEIVSLGGTPNEGGSISGAFHRGWLDLKAALSSGSDRGILDEASDAEDAAVRSYQEALAIVLPASTRQLFETHLAKVVDSARILKTLDLAVI